MFIDVVVIMEDVDMQWIDLSMFIHESCTSEKNFSSSPKTNLAQ